MAINIGNDAVKAIQDLRGNPDFAKLIDALKITVRDLMYASISSPEDKRLRQTSVVEGMREMLDGIEMAFDGKLHSQLTKVAPPGNPKFRNAGANRANDVEVSASV